MVALHLMIEMMGHVIHVDGDGLLLQILDALDSDLSVLRLIRAILNGITFIFGSGCLTFGLF